VIFLYFKQIFSCFFAATRGHAASIIDTEVFARPPNQQNVQSSCTAQRLDQVRQQWRKCSGSRLNYEESYERHEALCSVCSVLWEFRRTFELTTRTHERTRSVDPTYAYSEEQKFPRSWDCSIICLQMHSEEADATSEVQSEFL
jgi:hypothetical protein